MNLVVEVEKFYTYDSFIVEFTKIRGSNSDFIQIVEEIIDESKNL